VVIVCEQLSSSSEESSCDGSGARQCYGRRRAGVKMGVRHSVQQSAHSDPECLSSSEQSCVTAVYVGGGSGTAVASLSDREFTDSETASSVVTNVLSPQQRRGMVCVSAYEVFLMKTDAQQAGSYVVVYSE